MKLTKEEALWLADKFYDIYYALNVDEMYEKDQNIFRSIERKLSEIKWWKQDQGNLLKQILEK